MKKTKQYVACTAMALLFSLSSQVGKSQGLSLALNSTSKGVEASLSLLRLSSSTLAPYATTGFRGVRLLAKTPYLTVLSLGTTVYVALNDYTWDKFGENLPTALMHLNGRLRLEYALDQELKKLMNPEHFSATHWGGNLLNRLYYKSMTIQRHLEAPTSGSPVLEPGALEEIFVSEHLIKDLEAMGYPGDLATATDIAIAYEDFLKIAPGATYSVNLKDIIDFLLGNGPKDQKSKEDSASSQSAPTAANPALRPPVTDTHPPDQTDTTSTDGQNEGTPDSLEPGHGN